MRTAGITKLGYTAGQQEVKFSNQFMQSHKVAYPLSGAPKTSFVPLKAKPRPAIARLQQ